MSLQWLLIAVFLYVEIGIILLLVLPILNVRRWLKIFKSRFFEGIKAQIYIYFIIVLGLLVLCFVDAIREIKKYGMDDSGDKGNLGAEMQLNMRKFRAQRNFYISGFALFLYFVIRRLVILIGKEAELEIHLEATLKQAESANNAAQLFLEKQSNSSLSIDDAKKYEDKIRTLEEKLENQTVAKDDLARKYQDLSKEFDEVAKTLQKSTSSSSLKSEDKKKQ